MWVTLIQSAEEVTAKTEVSQRRRNSASKLQHRNSAWFPAFRLKTAMSPVNLDPRPAAHPADGDLPAPQPHESIP